MYDFDIELVKSLTNMPEEIRAKMARYWGRQAEQVQIEAIKFGLDLLKQSGIDNKNKLPEVFYSSFLKALSKMHYIETARAIREKSDSSDYKELQKISDIRIKRIKANKQAKSSPKSTKLVLQYRELVMQLRAKGMGWRRIAQYLQRFNRQKVSHQTLFKLFGGSQL
ncbi:MAG: hypothetical protein C4567_05390 [Deltaproteobacteria bacterium]|nr:MAG: hypothetical protein C4567_05390 [Deltaproteobacteria bacterium]